MTRRRAHPGATTWTASRTEPAAPSGDVRDQHAGRGLLLALVASAAPLQRNVTIEDVGNVAAFLLSDLAAGVTAEITYVDGGFSHVALAGE